LTAPRRFTGDRLVIATHNAGKVREIAALLAPYAKHFPSAGSLGLPEPAETGLTFRQNAELKAKAAAKASNLPALADDSGLIIPALGGKPGLHSALWAGPQKDFAFAMQRVHHALILSDAPESSVACFTCALSLAWPDGHAETFEGIISGALTWPPRGEHGFGYDPIFIPVSDTRTFAEIDHDAKTRISHRATAFRQLVAGCFAPKDSPC